MKALLLEGSKTLTLRDIDAPQPNAAAQLITVEATGIGGSEYLGFNKPGIRPLPNIMGHGFTGTTANGKRVAVYPLSGCGGCEYCVADQAQLCADWSLIGVQTDGGFAQKAAVPSAQLFELPAELSWEQSVFIEPFANSINAWELSGASGAQSVAIIGAGSLGLGLVGLAQQAGCKTIHVADLSANRRGAAKTLGATQTTSTLTETYDVVFDTVGSEQTRQHGIDCAKKGGQCVFLGFETATLNVNIAELIRYQKQLKGSFVYSKRQFSDAITLAKICQDTWVKNISFAEVENVLHQFLAGDFEHVKVALRPNGVA